MLGISFCVGYRRQMKYCVIQFLCIISVSYVTFLKLYNVHKYSILLWPSRGRISELN